jgi:hypothetical protein
MSHVVTIKTKLKSLSSIEKACQRLGWELLMGQTHYAWYGKYVGDYPLPDGFTQEQLGKCSHAIKVPGASYEIGVVENEDEYTLLYDFWSEGGLVPLIGGKDCPKFIQAYAVEEAKTQLQLQGQVYEDIFEDGTVELRLTV